MKTTNKKNGFTFVELIAVIGILALIMTLLIISFNRTRAQTRDSNRIHDAREIQTALELYFNRNASYPTLITPGQTLVANGVTYLDPVPNNSTPRNDGNCGDNNYTYSTITGNSNYEINFCLGTKTAEATQGSNIISKNGLNVGPGLVGWWKFEENNGQDVFDTTGNNNICHAPGSVELSGFFRGSQGNCKTGLCGEFNGTNAAYLDCGISENFAINSGTISVWFKTDPEISSNNNRLVELGSEGASERVGLFWAGGTVYLYGVKAGGEAINISATTSAPILANTWYYAVGTWDSNGANIYVKGTGLDGFNSTGEADKTLSLPQATKLYIGNFIGGGSGYTWNGFLDDVRIYDRALSVDEINAIYDSLK